MVFEQNDDVEMGDGEEDSSTGRWARGMDLNWRSSVMTMKSRSSMCRESWYFLFRSSYPDTRF